ncbi:MAG: hypothetical protein ACLQG3_10400 [Terracidiphilus sp.]
MGSQKPGSELSAVTRLCCAVFLFMISLAPATIQAQMNQQAKPNGSDLIPRPAVAAILSAYDKYEVVAMPEAHGQKDVDDFILTLIRNSSFPEKVNDIEVECGNSLFQPVLDRYIAGEDVPFAEVQKVWRNTTQQMCGTSEFFEEFFPLVRAINRNLPPEKRLRVLAGDPPIDWDQVKTTQDFMKFIMNRGSNSAAVMEKEVLSKHRRALMLFGTFHIMHSGHDDVTIYEADYPNVTFVISDFGNFDTEQFSGWPVPSLVTTKGNWLGALGLDQFLPAPFRIDDPKTCEVKTDFPGDLQKPMADLVDAFLYLGPQKLLLNEKMPADIALDVVYMTELQRRAALSGMPMGTPGDLKEFNQRIVKGAENPVAGVHRPNPAMKAVIEKQCVDAQNHGSTPK